MDGNSKTQLQNLLSICTSVPSSDGKLLPSIDGDIEFFSIDDVSHKNIIYSCEALRQKIEAYNLFNPEEGG